MELLDAIQCPISTDIHSSYAGPTYTYFTQRPRKKQPSQACDENSIGFAADALQASEMPSPVPMGCLEAATRFRNPGPIHEGRHPRKLLRTIGSLANSHTHSAGMHLCVLSKWFSFCVIEHAWIFSMKAAVRWSRSKSLHYRGGNRLSCTACESFNDDE